MLWYNWPRTALAKFELYGGEKHWFDDYPRNHMQQVKVTTKDGQTIFSKSLQNTIGRYQGGSL